MQVLWSVLLTRLFSGLAMVFPSPLNTVKTDDRCVNGWSVPCVLVTHGMFGNTKVHIYVGTLPHFPKGWSYVIRITSPNLP